MAGRFAVLCIAALVLAGLAAADAPTDVRAFVTRWLDERRSLLAAVRSRVLPEADVMMMNMQYPDATCVPPLTTRPFSFAECLHTPPMRARYRKADDRRRAHGHRDG
jgi:hypothetical protein